MQTFYTTPIAQQSAANKAGVFALPWRSVPASGQ